MEGLEQWSAANLGQGHYVLGYMIVLIAHNWPIFLAIALAIWAGIRLYRVPTRERVCWLFCAVLFGLTYEYQKHVAPELHTAIDFLFGMELLFLNPILHVIVGPMLTALLGTITMVFLYNALWLRFGSRRLVKRPMPEEVLPHTGK
ncbi:hypothetical protein HC891_17370 [Candidatus Gracilibacteria bacterium]|nr:hypothetical protein [Candidatus Gracilibacteria bacterium]